MKNLSKVALTLAVSAAGFFAVAPVALANVDTAGMVKCEGGNACKNTSACKTSSNQCKGQNACKGKGVSMEKTQADCDKAKAANATGK
jgi:hypothetical protein